jgi:hypothetical protein
LNSDIQTLATSVQGGCVNTTALTLGTATSNTTSAVWDSFHQATYSFTFDGGDRARWFFNAGGKLRITFGNQSTNSTGLDAVVSELFNNLGAFDIGATISSVSGNAKDDSSLGDSTRPESAAGAAGAGVDGRTLGYYDLTTDFKTLLDYYENSGTYDYSYNGLVSINIAAKVNAAHGDGRGNNGNVVTVRVRIENTDAGFTKATNYNQIAGKIDYDGKYAKIKENSCGPTTISFINRSPNTSEGLSTSYAGPAIAKVEAFSGEDAYVRGGTPGTITITNL